jgi:hypothetical protein
MKLACGAVLAGMIFAGCGQSHPPVATSEEVYVTVADAAGNEWLVSPGDLVHSGSENSDIQKVLAIDRRTGARCWVSVDDLLRDPPARARYIPVTRPAADADDEE